MWLSTSPGMSVMPRAVDGSVPAPVCSRTAASSPTATIVPVAHGDGGGVRPLRVQRADRGAQDREVGGRHQRGSLLRPGGASASRSM